MGSMVDTQILIYAFYLEGKRGPSKARERELDRYLEQSRPKCEASSALIARLGAFYVSAISVTELCRHMLPDEQEWFQGVLPRLNVVPFDGPVALEAARLIRARNQKEKLCSYCLNAINEHPCKVCKRRVASHQRINDAMIAACAEVSDRVSLLYTFDGGILSFKNHVTKCRIVDPMEPEPARAEPKPSKKPKQDAAKARQTELFGLLDATRHQLGGDAPRATEKQGEIAPAGAAPAAPEDPNVVQTD